jgi:thiol-disulfide isomerase/thioredoxin
MSEISDAEEGAGKGGGPRYVVLAIVVAVLVIAVALGVLYVMQGGASQMATPAVAGVSHEGPLGRYARGSLAKLETWKTPRPGSAVVFNDADGKPVSLAAFRGKIVVVNVWATWCAPCVVEMPTLAALQKRYPLAHLVVVPVSVDREKDLADAKNFIGVHDPLLLFNDPKFAVPSALGLHGLPSTVIYDPQGREVARLQGEARWDTPEAYAFFDKLLERT